MTAQRRPPRLSSAGYSYVEILIATAIISVSLIPASDSLRGAIQRSGIYSDYASNHYRLVAKMEEVLADAYTNIENVSIAAGSENTPTTYSDAVAMPNRRLVFLSPYDGDNADGDNDPFTGTDPGILWVRVELEGTAQSIEALTAL